MIAAVLALLLAGVAGSAGAAEFGVQNFDAQISIDASGGALTQAGGHPYAIATAINFNTEPKVLPLLGPVDWPVEPTKDVLTDTPAGLTGDPTSLTKCTMDQLAYDQGNQPTATGPLCPASSQVGTATVAIPNTPMTVSSFPLFNMVPPPDAPARFGFNVLNTIITADAVVRSGDDYGVSVNVRNSSEGLAIAGAQLTIWGVPSDAAHTPERACPGGSAPAIGGPTCSTEPGGTFLRLPTSCPADPTEGLTFTTHLDSWWNPGRQNADGTPDLSDPNWKTASFATHLPPGLSDAPFPGKPADQWGPEQGLTGCDAVPFVPDLKVTPSLPASPGSSGYSFDLTLPQTDDPDSIGTSDLKSVTVTLPEGVRVNPSSAHGLGGCSSADIGLHSKADAKCADDSKIGTVRIDTPLLEDPVVGSVYLATPFDNPSHSLIAVYLVAKAPGVILKLAGGVQQGGANGPMTATFSDMPQLPFSRAHIEFFDGPNAPLSNPATCGPHTTHAVMTSWSGKTVPVDSTFTTSHDGRGAPCPAPQFKPSFSAGTTSPIAGRSSPFTLTIGRTDDDQEIASVESVQMPDGLTAIPKGVKLCEEAKAVAGTCDAASQIGTVTTEAGTGPDPFGVTGKAFLGGPYKGAPFSINIAVPVKAGPFDLGTVVVRGAIALDRHDATLDVRTDPLPTALQGIPLQIRRVNITINRRQFILNPTSCAAKRIGARIRSTGGLVAQVSDRFSVTNCAALRFAPKLTFKAGGKGHLRQRSSTPLKSVLRMPKGGANLKSVSVSLPLALNAQLEVVNNACTEAEFEAKKCEDARAGSAVAVTPLLDRPLRGGVFFVKDPKKKPGSLPNLIVSLHGQVDFDLVSGITIPGGSRLATTFRTIPDVPVSKFTLSFVSGPKGPLSVAENLCSKKAQRERVALVFRAQNGLVTRVRQPLDVAGCHKKR